MSHLPRKGNSMTKAEASRKIAEYSADEWAIKFTAKTISVDRGFRTPCLEWTRYIHQEGYGEFNFCMNGKYGRIGAHRAAWIREHGPIPDGFEPDHLCRNRKCTNTEHLEVVTHKENILRGESPSAVNARKSACPKGHPLSGENVYIWEKRPGRFKRHCKTCSINSQTERRRRIRELLQSAG